MAPIGTAQCSACDDMLAVASAVERRSEHPLARAILTEAESRDLLQRYPSAQTVQALAGQGIVGSLDRSTVIVGSHALFHEHPVDCVLHDQVEAAEREGQTVMLVGRDDRLLGFVAAADTPREASREAIRALKQLDAHARLVMLTGDSPAVARAIAKRIGGVDEVRACLLPADKLEAIRSLQQRNGPVAMIGDGVNDAPALAAADVSIAMGAAGTAQAMETADLVLMQDDLRRLPEAVRTSRRARQTIRQNILFSLLVKAAILALAVAGLGSLWMAVFADVGASLLVTLNGMRLLRARS
jgi:Cd2+/Zn2+-exporting ATPase